MSHAPGAPVCDPHNQGLKGVGCMSSPIRRLGEGLVVALAASSTLLVGARGQTSAGQTPQSATLTLDPVTGPPGTPVTATGGGYGDCSSNDDVGPESVSLFWDGMKLVTVDINDGSFSATFLVPDSASPDTGHNVVARCAVFGVPEASRKFTVTGPVEELAVVPDVVGMTIGEARDALGAARLELGEVSGTGDLIGEQVPTAGTEVEPGTAVHVGLAAVEAVKSFRPDVVLLDISLPKLDGHEAARRIRSQDGGKQIVLVALTGWAQEEDRRRSKEAGFDEHMLKPVDYAELTKFLAKV